jgi:hypothetical protein
MLSPDDPAAREFVAGIVRDLATSARSTTITRIGDMRHVAYAVTNPVLHTPDLDYAELLAAYNREERRNPLSVPVSACALILPDRDVAYLKHGTEAMTVLSVGPNPRDDPDTHRAVEDGLTTLMQILLDTQPAQRPTGRPFPTTPGRMPNTTSHLPHINGWRPPQPGRDASGPHR